MHIIRNATMSALSCADAILRYHYAKYVTKILSEDRKLFPYQSLFFYYYSSKIKQLIIFFLEDENLKT